MRLQAIAAHIAAGTPWGAVRLSFRASGSNFELDRRVESLWICASRQADPFCPLCLPDLKRLLLKQLEMILQLAFQFVHALSFFVKTCK